MNRYLVPVMLLVGAASPAFAEPAASAVTPETQQKIDTVRATFHAQIMPIAKDARATRQALRAELAKAEPDDATLSQLEQRLADDRTQMQALHAQTQADLEQQLTPRELGEIMLDPPRFGHRAQNGGAAQ